MSTPLLPDALWNLIRPMLPVHTTSAQGWQTSPTRACVSHRRRVEVSFARNALTRLRLAPNGRAQRLLH